LLNERDITALAPNQRNVGMVFQSYALFPNLTVAQNIAFGLEVRKRPKAEIQQMVAEMLRLIRLEAFGGRYPNQLSGGQQQRVALARALAIQPEVLLMDEPASALDPIATQKIEELIHELKTRYTIVIVTHNMQQAARVSDMTAFFYMGELVEYDETETIFTRPEKKRTEDYITGRFG